LKRVQQIPTLALTVFAIFAVVGIELLVRDLRAEIPPLHAMITNGGTASGKVIAAEDQQIRSWQNIEQEVAKTVAKMNDLAVHTDVSLNGTHNHPELGLLPTLTGTVQAASGTVAKLGDSAQAITTAAKSLDDVGPQTARTLADVDTSVKTFTASSAELLAGATADLTDPDLKRSEANIGTASDSLAAAATDAAASMADVRRGVHFEVEALLAPPKKVWVILKGAAGLAGNFFHL
jgi:hypothetical protein